MVLKPDFLGVKHPERCLATTIAYGDQVLYHCHKMRYICRGLS